MPRTLDRATALSLSAHYDLPIVGAVTAAARDIKTAVARPHALGEECEALAALGLLTHDGDGWQPTDTGRAVLRARRPSARDTRSQVRVTP